MRLMPPRSTTADQSTVPDGCTARHSHTDRIPLIDARDLAGVFPARRGVSPKARDRLSRIERRRLTYLPI
jgi:hypothetical protein